MEGPGSPAKPWNWGAELLTWTLAGGLFAVAARESGRNGARAIGLAAAVAGGVCLAIETFQLLVPERDVDLTSVVLALLGSTIGAAASWSALVAKMPGKASINPAIAIWALAVILAVWNPPRLHLAHASSVPAAGKGGPVLVVF